MTDLVEVIAAVDKASHGSTADIDALIDQLSQSHTAEVIRKTDHFVTFRVPEAMVQTIADSFRGRLLVELNRSLTQDPPIFMGSAVAVSDAKVSPAPLSEDDDIREF